MVAIILIFIIGAAIWWCPRFLRRKRLTEKYGNVNLVDRLMRKDIWEGQTTEQLVDSRGRPAAIDNKVLKTKTCDTWKYAKTGKGRYALRIFIENGAVVGWKRNAR